MATPRPGRGPAVSIKGLRDLQSDLRKIDKGAAKELRDALKSEVTREVLPDAISAAPKSKIQKSPTRHLAGSLRPFVSGSTVGVRSRLPYANIVHWGGRHPLFGNRDHWVQVQGRPFISEAVARHENRLVDRAANAIDHLASLHGWH